MTRPRVLLADDHRIVLAGLEALLAADVLAAPGRRPAREPTSGLTPRQREIIVLLVEGRSAKEIAKRLDISHRTVEYHKYQAMETLGVKTNAELIQIALRLRIFP